MRRVGAGTAAALLWLGLLVPAAPAQSTDVHPVMVGEEESSWLGNLLFGKPKPEPKPEKPGPDRGKEQERLRNAYLRRQAVCDRLLEIAEQTNDAALRGEAERLDEQAWKLYQEESARLTRGAAGLAPDPLAPAAKKDSPPPKPRFRGGESMLGGAKEEER
jgi:hypothetical protein